MDLKFELYVCTVFVEMNISVHRWMVFVLDMLHLLSVNTVRERFLHGMPDTSRLFICCELIYLNIFTGKLLSIL